MIQKDVARRVCSGASVRPSAVRLPAVRASSAANFGVKMGLGLFSEAVGALDTKMPAELEGFCEEGFNGASLRGVAWQPVWKKGRF